MYSSDEALKDALNTIERYYAVIYKLYDQKLKESNSLDFDDLQIYVYKLFDTNPEVLVKW
ncbi:ATP-dependent DNA helicase Rep, partial [Mycoplasma putrefaciens]